MRRPFIRWPLTALLLWLSWLAGTQWLTTLRSEDDWSDDYVRSEATIIGSRAVLSSTAGSSGIWSCVLLIEWQFRDEVHRDEPTWLRGGISRNRLADDCGRERLDEVVPIWIAGTTAAEPFILEPGNRSAKPLSGTVNLAQMFFFLALVWLLWKRPSSRCG